MATAIREFADAKQAAGYRKLRDWLTRLYPTEFDGFIAGNFDSPLSLVNPQLARLAAIGGFRKWDTMVNRHITDPRLQRVFTFQSLYAGVAPQQALAVYAVIAYMDTVSGVFFPRGGMRALPDALAAAATDAGVRFVYGATVTGLERAGDRVAAVHTDQDQRIACDAVVLTTELPPTYTLLGREPRRIGRAAAGAVGRRRPRRPSPDAVGGSRTGTSQHRLRRRMGADVHRHHPRRPADAGSVAARHQADGQRPEPGPARPRSVLRPCPGAEPHPRCRRLVAPSVTATPTSSSISLAARLIPGLRDGAEVLHVVNPADWARQGMIAGTPFALAHTFAQTGPFRPANTVRGIDNAVLAGSSTVPGVGVPTALISGRLAADRITGIVDRSKRTRRGESRSLHDPHRADRRRHRRSATCAAPTGAAAPSTPPTAAPSFWPPGCWRPTNVRRSTRCTALPATPTTSSTISIRP